MKKRIHVVVVMGTRPEALKLAPVIYELQRRRRHFKVVVCATAQHRDLLDQVVNLYRIPIDYDLDLMKENQQLHEVTARALTRLSKVFRRVHPDIVVVQGDTTTAFAASLAAFYEKIPIAHVEAGLRTQDRFAPFPEEINRRLTTHLADLHFAPTPWARRNLLREGIAAASIEVTGNTIVDTFLQAVHLVRKHPPAVPCLKDLPRNVPKLIVVTAHRRENFGAGIENICRALRTLVETHSDIHIVYPVHPNPHVRGPVFRLLRNVDRIHLIPPLAYLSFVWLMTRAYLVLTDSGGIQEEVPSIGVPVLVMRDNTERPEGVEAGVCRLVGTQPERIVSEVSRLLVDRRVYRKSASGRNPFGDGKASRRIVEGLHKHFLFAGSGTCP